MQKNVSAAQADARVERPPPPRVPQALGELVGPAQAGPLASLTWDPSPTKVTVATDVAVDVVDPRTPWQRGSHEHTNGLLGQYLQKGTDLSVHSQAHRDAIALKPNTQPGKTRGFRTPAATLRAAVASSG